MSKTKLQAATLWSGAAAAAWFGFGPKPLGGFAWVALCLLLLAWERAKPVPGLLLLLFVTNAVSFAHWWGSAPGLPVWAQALLLLATTSIYVLPFLFHRLSGMRGVGKDLLFAALFVSCDWLMERSYSSFGSIAYSLADSPITLQLVSVTGYTGLTFLLALGAAWGARASLRLKGDRFSLLFFPLLLAAVLGFGAKRLNAPQAEGRRVAVAALHSGGDMFLAYLSRDPERMRKAAESELRAYWAQAMALKGPVQAVLLPEVAFIVAPADRPTIEAAISKLAKELNAPVVFGLGLSGAESFENVAVVARPDGSITSRPKVLPAPGEPIRPAELERIEIPLKGALAVPLVCAELESSGLTRKVAGADAADLLLVLAHELPAIEPRHSRMAAVRGVELGVSMVKASNGGLTLATDYLGRPSGQERRFELPLTSAVTFYRGAGDWFPALCLFLVFLSAIPALWRYIRR